MTRSRSGAEEQHAAEAGPSLLYRVKRVERAVRSHLDQLLKPAGLTALQYTALTVLQHHDGQSAAQLARSSFVTPQSMADLIRTLEQRDLVRRQAHAGDRRQLLIFLTADGHRLLDDHADAVGALEAEMTNGLRPAEVVQLRIALDKAWLALRETSRIAPRDN